MKFLFELSHFKLNILVRNDDRTLASKGKEQNTHIMIRYLLHRHNDQKEMLEVRNDF
jgi:hypothetical protein